MRRLFENAWRLPCAVVVALAVVALAAFGPTPGRAAGEVLPGPLPARVVAVVDGDTLEVSARIWLGQAVRVRVRLAGIDAPELRGKCAAERRAAGRAKAFLTAAVADGEVRLSQIRYGKYAGRVLARIAAADGRDLGQALLARGLARVYDGGKRPAWCRLLADGGD